MSAAPRASGLRHFLPEASRLWIRHAPSAWPGAPGWWIHLADRTLGAERAGEPTAIDPAAADDVVYLPPVPEGLRITAEAHARAIEAAGGVAIRQRFVGDVEAGRYDVLDPLSALLARGARGLRELETGCRVAVWPLVAGLTDRPADWTVGFAALRAAGVSTVVPMVLDLDPGCRRRLADLTDEVGYQVLFHGPAPDLRACVRAVVAAGLRPLVERPPLAAAPRQAFARRVAAELIQAAELWFRLGRPEAAGQDLLRAARWLERVDHDLRALAREGNLEVLPWLDARGRRLVEDLAADRVPVLRVELEGEYLGEAG